MITKLVNYKYNYHYSDNLMLEVINTHVAKISLALQEGDSILHLSRKIGSSYGWTHRWVKELEDLDIIESDAGIKVLDQELLNEFRELGKSILRRKMDLKDAYLLPNFSGMKYAFTKTDAVFIWTEGGYQIARSRKDYPIFIKILEDDLGEWNDFFEGFSVEYRVGERDGEGIYFVLYTEENFESEWVENSSVMPLRETVEWAQKYKMNFQPALEMLDEKYGLGLNVEYKERVKI